MHHQLYFLYLLYAEFQNHTRLRKLTTLLVWHLNLADLKDISIIYYQSLKQFFCQLGGVATFLRRVSQLLVPDHTLRSSFHEFLIF